MRARIAAALMAAVLGTAGVGSAAASVGGDPAQLSAKRWRTLKPSPLERTEVAAARVGRFIYVAGGFMQPGGATTNKVARYDIRRDRWRVVAPMPIAVNHPTAAPATWFLPVLIAAPWVQTPAATSYISRELSWSDAEFAPPAA